MAKKKSAEVYALMPTASHEEAGGEGHKKKKKKRKRTESQEGEGGEEAAHNLTLASLTSSPGLTSPGKKKKKKRKSLDGELLQTTINGVQEEEEEEEGKTKKKKKRRKSEAAIEEEEKEKEEVVVTVEDSVPKKKKRKKKGEEGEEESPKKKKKEKKKEEKEEEEEKVTAVQEEEEESSRKKKKKKKKEEQVNTTKEQEEEEEEEEEESPSKKKKKKKRKKQEEEEEKEKLQSPPVSTSTPTTTTTPTTTSSTTSTKGKKKAKLKEEEVEEKKKEEEEEEEEEAAEDGGWTQEETFDLLERVKQQFLNDKRSCGVSLGGVDWGAAAPPGHTPDDTREHFMALYKEINRFKTLVMVVEEVRSLVESGMCPRPKRLLNPYNRFLKDFLTHDRMLLAKKKGESAFRLGIAAWKNLSEEEREKYTSDYKKERARFDKVKKTKPAKVPDNPIKLPKLPHQLYRDDADDSTKGGNRPHYTSLTPSQQLPYIRRSLEEHIQYQADVEAHSATHPSASAQSGHAICKSDLKLYLESHGYPELPPTRPQTVLYRELLQKGELEGLTGLKKMSEALRRYREMSAQEQLVYKERQAKSTRSYEEDLRKWAEKQDAVTQFALKKYHELIRTRLSKKVVKPRARTSTPEDVFEHTAPAVLTQCPKFFGEPPRPVPSPFKLFALKLRSTYEDLRGTALQRAMREGWKELTAEEVSVYESRCRLLHREFEKEVKAYVQQMDPKNRRLYLGFNRYTLFKFFGNRDVFAEDFPNSDEYPVFIKGQKQSPASPSKAQEEEDEDEDEEESEDEEEVEEEEEEEEKEKPTKKTTKLSPIQFSSLKLSPSSSPKKPSSASPSKKTKAPPPPPVSDSEEEEKEEEEEVNVTNGSPIKKSEKKSTTNTSKPPPPPQPKSDSESSADEMDVTPAWLSPQVTQQKKKSTSTTTTTTTTKSKKQPQPPLPPKSDSESESDDEEEEVAPAWLSPQVSQPKKETQKQPQEKKKKEKVKDYSSSSSGFSD